MRRRGRLYRIRRKVAIRTRRLRRRLHRWWIRLMWAGVVVVGLAVAVLAASVVAPGVVGSHLNESPILESDGPSAPPEATVEEGYNLNKTERIFITLLNEERRSQDLEPVQQRDDLTDMGREHSQNMAENEYLGHTEPDGTSIEDRYRQRGLLPECELPSKRGGYYPGAENVAEYYVDQTVRMETGDLYVNSEKDLAQGLFRSWMYSTGHRRAMLVYSADQAGLGLHITDRGKVYASLELC